MITTDPQIRETLVGLVAIVEREREEIYESNVTLGDDGEATGVVEEDEIARCLAHMDAQVAAGRICIEELDRRAAELARLQAAGGALA